MSEIIELNEKNFEKEVLKSQMPIIVDFWAEWCMPCKMLAPTIEKIARDYKDKIKVCKVNVDSNQELSSSLGIRSIPTLLFFLNGEMVEQVIGVINEIQLKKVIDKVFKK